MALEVFLNRLLPPLGKKVNAGNAPQVTRLVNPQVLLTDPDQEYQT